MRLDEFLGTIKLSADSAPMHDRSPIVQVLRVTKFDHPEYGTIEITADRLKQFKENFEKRVRRQEIPIDYFHENEGLAAGWIKELFFDESGNELWARVDWTKNALQKLNEKELKYFSPEFSFKWTDPETKVSYDNVLFGGGLTNRPQVKDMAPIILKEKTERQMEEKVKELETQVIKLGEDLIIAKDESKKMMDMGSEKDAKISELEAMIAEINAKMEALKGENEAMLAEKAKAEEEKKKLFKENEFNTMLSEGKVCAAQKDAFIAGDMAEFVKHARPVNLSEKGSNENSNNENKDAADEVLKLSEAKAKAEKISLDKAISLVLKENDELRNRYQNQ